MVRDRHLWSRIQYKDDRPGACHGVVRWAESAEDDASGRRGSRAREAVSGRDWIPPAESVETGEVGVAAAEDQAVLHGQGSQVSVGDQV